MRYLRQVKQLNQVEQWKLERHPLDVRDAVVDRYAREGPEAIKTVPGEVERLKWVGLYPQRQGGDAFMLRIKVPGGVKTPMHAHLAYCIVEIRDMETGVKAGDSSCGNAMAHESPNNAKSVNEAITIE